MPQSQLPVVPCDPAGFDAGPADRAAGPAVLHTNDLVICDGRQQVARHDRLPADSKLTTSNSTTTSTR